MNTRRSHWLKESRLRFAFVGFAVGLLLCGGCGKTNRNLAPVSGEVFYKGKPLAYGTITFVSAKNRSGSGEIKDGKIVNVMTFEKNDGVPVGRIQIAISALDRSEKYRNKMVPPSLIPRKYDDYSKSGLTAKIVAGQNNELRFDLK